MQHPRKGHLVELRLSQRHSNIRQLSGNHVRAKGDPRMSGACANSCSRLNLISFEKPYTPNQACRGRLGQLPDYDTTCGVTHRSGSRCLPNSGEEEILAKTVTLVLDVQKPADSDSDLVTVLVVLKRYINSIGNSFHDIYVYNII